ncbi:MAG: NAD(+) synthase [Alphaproteobacteria bacterium]|nr:NAD(+) synthase [Alphaproteobacteria bacterium]
MAPNLSPYAHGFARVAAATPAVGVGAPLVNVAAATPLVAEADTQGAALVLFPELSLSAYAIDDLHLQDALLDAVEQGIATLAAETAGLRPALIVGAPLRHRGAVYNCAIVIHAGRILGVVPKTYLPNYREYYEKRWFASGRDVRGAAITVAGQEAPFGVDLLFDIPALPGATLGIEICEDVWAPIPPSTLQALAGATVLLNLSASNVTIGKAAERKQLCSARSAACAAAYVYSASGPGESTTDLAWDGQAAVFELGAVLAEGPRFSPEPTLLVADIDLDRIRQDRMRNGTFRDTAANQHVPEFRRVEIPFTPPAGQLPLARVVDRFPYVPADPAQLDANCFEAYNIQVQGLETRLRATGTPRVVIGVSGGLDSTHALIVASKTFDRLGRPRSDILGFTLPGFATSEGTRANAIALMQALGVTVGEIDIRPAARQMLADMDHPFARGEAVYDVTFENVQAGLRTDYLFRLANQREAIVVGTGDLSELALGWCTYGVGDHMSHYNVNASVSKTLIQHLIRWCATSGQYDAATAAVLLRILDTEISPELVPADASGKMQSTQDTIGPYALHDFALYYITRYGLRPSKIAYLAEIAWSDAARGAWPPGVPAKDRVAYDRATIVKWLEVFLRRFFATSQFKRSAVPNGPKVSSGGSLSPRGDWRAPSDGSAEPWLDELRRNVPL